MMFATSSRRLVTVTTASWRQVRGIERNIMSAIAVTAVVGGGGALERWELGSLIITLVPMGAPAFVSEICLSQGVAFEIVFKIP